MAPRCLSEGATPPRTPRQRSEGPGEAVALLGRAPAAPRWPRPLGLPGNDRKRSGEAVALLRKAYEAGYFKERRRAPFLDVDRDLDGLRTRADFKRLMDDIKKGG